MAEINDMKRNVKVLMQLFEKFRRYNQRLTEVRPESLHLFLYDCSNDIEHVSMLEEILKIQKNYDVKKLQEHIFLGSYNYYNILHEMATQPLIEEK